MSRLADFDQYLKANNIPIFGVQEGVGTPPASITIDFKPEATQEQRTWAEQAKETWDWRRRRALTRQQIANHISGLTTQQRNALLLHLFAMLFRQNRTEGLSILADLAIALPVDEVDPT